MYTLMIQFLDGARHTSQWAVSQIGLDGLNLDTIEEIWMEDEAGNVVDHWSREDLDDESEDDGQPTEYEEWQDYMGGDDWDHGQYDQGGW